MVFLPFLVTDMFLQAPPPKRQRDGEELAGERRQDRVGRNSPFMHNGLANPTQNFPLFPLTHIVYIYIYIPQRS